MDKEVPKRRYRLILDFKSQFPEKLYEVANDGALIKWNRNGSVSVPDTEAFEENVMKWYPGFLQIPSFQNLKRLFREYGFDRDVNEKNQYEWSHEMLVPGRRDLLSEIKTRRKSYKTPQNREFDQDSIVATPAGRRFPLRKRARTKRFSSNSETSQSITDYGGAGEGLSPANFTSKQSYVLKNPFESSGSEAQEIKAGSFKTDDVKKVENNYNENAVKRDFKQLMNDFAEKEFSEDEYNEWLAKQRKLDEARNNNTEQVTEKSNEFWWMYKDNPNEIVQTVNIPVRQPVNLEELSTPCGFCKCCSAISNYVHVFGEVPENIQVIDCLEEVVECVEPEIKLGQEFI